MKNTKTGQLMLIMGILILSAGLFSDEIIENSDKPLNPDAGRVVTLKKILEIRDDGDRFFFDSPHNLKIGPDGTIFVADTEALFQFDANGKLLRNLVKAGEGPKEMRRAREYILTAEEIVIQGFPPKIIRFGYDGGYLGEFRITAIAPQCRLKAAHKGRFYFTQQDRPNIKGDTDFVDMDQQFTALGETGEALERGLAFPINLFVASGGGAMGIFNMTELLSTPMEERFLFLSHTEDYLIKLYDCLEGKVLRSFRRKYDRIKTPPLKKGDKISLVVINKKRIQKPSTKYLNDIEWLGVNGDRLWVLTSTSDEAKGRLFDIFDFEGRYVDSFYIQFPNNFAGELYNYLPVAVCGSDLFTIEKDGDGYSFIAKYRIEDRIAPDRP